MTDPIRVHPTGYENYLEEDRPTIHATFGAGNTDQLEVHLEWTDLGQRLAGGWFSVQDLQNLITQTIENYEKGNPQ